MILAFYGASGLGSELRVIAQLINEKELRWSEMFFVDDDPAKNGTELAGMKVMSFIKAIEIYGKENLEFVLSIGEPAVKDIIYQKLKDNDCMVTNLFHPTANIDPTSIFGEGIVIGRMAGIPPYGVFGNNIKVNGFTAIGHNVQLGDNVVVSAFAFIGGDTKIGRNTYIGPHACLRNGINIGENVIVGMGSVVTKDVPDNAVVYGNPAKVMRYNDSGRVFKK